MTLALLESQNDFPFLAEDHGLDNHQQAKDPHLSFTNILMHCMHLSVSTQYNLIWRSRL